MHEKVKDFLHKTGTTRAPNTIRDEHSGMHHKEMHEHEKIHFEGKKHHRETEL